MRSSAPDGTKRLASSFSPGLATGHSARAAINRAMEKLIVQVPAQYFWSYNRYKTPDGVAGPDQASATETPAPQEPT